MKKRLSRLFLGCVAVSIVSVKLESGFKTQAQQSPSEKCAQAPFVRGQKGRLFQNYDFTPTPIVPANILPYVIRMNDALKSAGTKLVILPIPNKAALISSTSDSLSNEQFSKQSLNIEASKKMYRQSILELESHGISTIDLLASIPSERQSNFFFKTDHHWSPDGAKMAATATRIKLEQLGLAKLDLSSRPFETYIESQRLFEGSTLASFHTYCPDEAWAAEPSVRYRTSQEYTESNDLLGNLQQNVVLAGTSNSAPERDFNFSGFLEQEIKVPVLLYAQSARWLTGWLAAYITSEDFAKHKPNYLIWEFPILFWTEPGLTNDDYIPWFRHLIPSIAGACSATNELQLQRVMTTKNQRQYPISINSKKIIGNRFYVHIDTLASKSKKMTFVLEYTTGISEEIKLDFSDRSGNNGQFYIELKTSLNKPLERVTVIPNPDDWPSEFEMQICTK